MWPDRKQIQNSFIIVVKLRPRFPKESNFPFFFIFFSIKVFFLYSNRLSSSGWLWKAMICSTKNGFQGIMELWMYFSSREKWKFRENHFWRTLQLWNCFQHTYRPRKPIVARNFVYKRTFLLFSICAKNLTMKFMSFM